ncbi:protein of unknown function (DUF3328) domain containing protein [Rhypophila sp. PSN 637]
MFPFIKDRTSQSQYSKLLGREGPSRFSSEDETDPSVIFLAQRELIWRRRFYVLLLSSVSVLLVLAGGAAHEIYYITHTGHPADLYELPQPPKSYTPAPVQYVTKMLKHAPDAHLFMGRPRPELDQAWHELVSATMIRFSAEELGLASEHELDLAQKNASSLVRHRDGGFIGGLGVSHNLHCLKRIKQYIYPEYYPRVAHKYDDYEAHFEHCLETIRQALLCAADTNLYALEWTAKNPLKPGLRLFQANTCVDWEALRGWMKGRLATGDDMLPSPADLEHAAPAEDMGAGGMGDHQGENKESHHHHPEDHP